MTTTHDAPPSGPVGRTSEGAQELTSADVASGAERLRERGAVLRLSEEAVAEAAEDQAPDDDTMLINMGPQHPSTHGVLRLMLELQGETVLRCKPIIGYLHTGMERTGEELTYLQGPTNVTRMDYASPLFTELAFSLTVERLLDIEVPERAV
jgi:NADH-quinone oxidoreductase subunit D